MTEFSETIRRAAKNSRHRDYPNRQDQRFRDDRIYPHVTPKFKIDFDAAKSIFTIGSCFARNIEEALESYDVILPTRGLSVPQSEFPWRANGLLNEYNPGSISQRILWALEGRDAPAETIVPSGSQFTDLMLFYGSDDVSYERAVERRGEIRQIYEKLKTSDVVVITLGFVEAWYDQEAKCFLNKMPPHRFAASHPNRFDLRRMDVFDAMPPLEKALRALSDLGKNIVLTVSPVPLGTTFVVRDCVTANEFSKAVLRVCAERLANNIPHVDYFPSYEIVRSMGLEGYIDDNMHVKDAVVRDVTKYMIDMYRGEPVAQAAE